MGWCDGAVGELVFFWCFFILGSEFYFVVRVIGSLSYLFICIECFGSVCRISVVVFSSYGILWNI